MLNTPLSNADAFAEQGTLITAGQIEHSSDGVMRTGMTEALLKQLPSATDLMPVACGEPVIVTYDGSAGTGADAAASVGKDFYFMGSNSLSMTAVPTGYTFQVESVLPYDHGYLSDPDTDLMNPRGNYAIPRVGTRQPLAQKGNLIRMWLAVDDTLISTTATPVTDAKDIYWDIAAKKYTATSTGTVPTSFKMLSAPVKGRRLFNEGTPTEGPCVYSACNVALFSLG